MVSEKLGFRHSEQCSQCRSGGRHPIVQHTNNEHPIVTGERENDVRPMFESTKPPGELLGPPTHTGIFCQLREAASKLVAITPSQFDPETIDREFGDCLKIFSGLYRAAVVSHSKPGRGIPLPPRLHPGFEHLSRSPTPHQVGPGSLLHANLGPLSPRNDLIALL